MADFLLWAGGSYLLFSLLAPGATLTQANRLVLTLGGALIGLLGAPLALQLGNPAHTADLIPRLVSILLTFALLLIPALAVLDGPQRPRLSAADGFLLGFLPGFGFDALAAFLRVAAGQEATFSWLPPATLAGWAGYGYWCGLITLAWTAAYRLSQLEGHAQFWSLTALLWATFDRLAASGPPSWLLPYVRLTFEGRLFPCVTLVLLFYLAYREDHWVRRSPGMRQLENLAQLRVPSLGQAGAGGLLARERARGLRRQLFLERTEQLERGRTSMGEIPTAYTRNPFFLDPIGWGLRLLSLALAAFLLLDPIGKLSLPLALAASALILAQFLRATALDLGDANSEVATLAQAVALNGGLAAALFALCFSSFTLGFPPMTAFGALEKGFGPGTLAGVALALALLAASLQDPSRREWQLLLEPGQRRVSAVHRGLTVLFTVLLAVAGAWLYGPWQASLQGVLAGKGQPGLLVHFTAVLSLGCLLALAASLLGRGAGLLEEALERRG